MTATAGLLLLVLLRPGAGPPDPAIAFSLEEAVEMACGELGGDPALLEGALEALLAASVQESPVEIVGGFGPLFLDSPLFWEGLTEEELRYIAEELRKEIKS